MNRQETAIVVAALNEAFPSMVVTGETITVWVRYLADVSVEEAAAAVDRLILSSRYVPTIGDLRREMARARCKDRHVGIYSGGGEAWLAEGADDRLALKIIPDRYDRENATGFSYSQMQKRFITDYETMRDAILEAVVFGADPVEAMNIRRRVEAQLHPSVPQPHLREIE